MELIKSEHQKEKQILKNESSLLRDLWNNNEHANIHIIGVPEGEEKGIKMIWGN